MKYKMNELHQNFIIFILTSRHGRGIMQIQGQQKRGERRNGKKKFWSINVWNNGIHTT